jgi:hypothetical protein
MLTICLCVRRLCYDVCTTLNQTAQLLHRTASEHERLRRTAELRRRTRIVRESVVRVARLGMS